MDQWPSKRSVESSRHGSKKGVGVVLRDRFNSSCSNEKKPMKFTRFVGSSDNKKEKSVWSSSRCYSPNGKEVIGSSSSSSVKSEKQPMFREAVDSSEDEVESKGRVHNKLIYGNAESSNLLPSSSRIKKGFRQRFGLSKQEIHPSSSASTSANRGGCSPLLSGVIPSGFRLEKRFSPKVDTTNHKRRVHGESSSSASKGKKNVTESQADERRYGFNPRGPITDTRRAARQCVNDLTSVGNQRSVNRSSSRIRFSNRGSGRNGLLPSVSNETSNNLNSPVSLELFSGFQDFGSLSRQDSFSSYSLDGISEILPELDRIEQDIELNYEELLIMETGLLLGGLSLYDQHRDMRLDIDNMSYEELLALEEKIGTVSTALTEEAISKCLKTSIYNQMKPSSFENDKCSICQEEYTVGDEVGRLHCEHAYHLRCAQEWLRMKSWCPICKANAEASSPSK